MARKRHTKNKKRRSTKKRSPLSPAKKRINKRTLSKKQLKKVLNKNAAIEKKRNVQAAQRQIISLPIGRGKTIVLALSHMENSSYKKKKPTKLAALLKKYRTKKKELVTPSLIALSGLFGMVFFGLQVMAASPPPLAMANVATHNAVVASLTNEFLPRSNPTVLRIPTIELESTLSSVGMGSDGSIEVPEDYTKAGWYRSSPTPGEKGPAVIVGHLDNIHGQAIFWRLSELLPGQIIEITREDGKTIQFSITQIKQFSQDSFPTDEVFGNIDHSGLRLITCGGTFNYLTQHYSDNTVVFASLVT